MWDAFAEHIHAADLLGALAGRLLGYQYTETCLGDSTVILGMPSVSTHTGALRRPADEGNLSVAC